MESDIIDWNPLEFLLASESSEYAKKSLSNVEANKNTDEFFYNAKVDEWAKEKLIGDDDDVDYYWKEMFMGKSNGVWKEIENYQNFEWPLGNGEFDELVIKFNDENNSSTKNDYVEMFKGDYSKIYEILDGDDSGSVIEQFLVEYLGKLQRPNKSESHLKESQLEAEINVDKVPLVNKESDYNIAKNQISNEYGKDIIFYSTIKKILYSDENPRTKVKELDDVASGHPEFSRDVGKIFGNISLNVFPLGTNGTYDANYAWKIRKGKEGFDEFINKIDKKDLVNKYLDMVF